MIGLLGVTLAGLFVSGCATFKGDQLPKQTVKSHLRKEAFLVSEFVSLDGMTSVFALEPVEYFAPYLRHAITTTGNTISLPATLQGRIDAEMNKYNALPEQTRRILIANQTTYNQSYGTATLDVKDLTGNMPLEAVTALYKDRVVKKETAKFFDSIRKDPKLCEQMLPAGTIWIDCVTFLAEGNESTWFLEGLLCSCSLTLIPAHHNRVIDVKVTVYENGKIYKREYKDFYNMVCWLPLFPLGLIQGGWPDAKVVDSVADNIAVCILNDALKDHGKNNAEPDVKIVDQKSRRSYVEKIMGLLSLALVGLLFTGCAAMFGVTYLKLTDDQLEAVTKIVLANSAAVQPGNPIKSISAASVESKTPGEPPRIVLTVDLYVDYSQHGIFHYSKWVVQEEAKCKRVIDNFRQRDLAFKFDALRVTDFSDFDPRGGYSILEYGTSREELLQGKEPRLEYKAWPSLIDAPGL